MCGEGSVLMCGKGSVLICGEGSVLMCGEGSVLMYGEGSVLMCGEVNRCSEPLAKLSKASGPQQTAVHEINAKVELAVKKYRVQVQSTNTHTKYRRNHIGNIHT